ncbi:MAG TPA: sigma-70 family RNA polymerase sigma factor [Bacillales bacterium]|nr:sigma-70 family RNA polymerase sigma factor [Bacillales bacterium]
MVSIIQLIKKAQNGNSRAFSKLFQHFQADLYRTAFVYVKNQQDALDVVQETAYRSFKSIHTLKEPKYLKTWFIKIVISCSIDLIRRRKKAVPLKPEYEGLISGDIEEDIPLSMSLQEFIELLSEDEKSVIILRFYHDLSIKEVSEALTIPLGTAKTILYRALKKLRKQWEGGGVNEQSIETRNE